jgi:secreted PhoX family phosphatase
MELFKKNTLMQAMLMAALASGLAACGSDGDDGSNGTNGTNGSKGDDGSNGTDGEDGQSGVVLKRLASAPKGAEFTGMYLNSDGTFFINTQHPSTDNTTEDGEGKVFDKGTVGVVVGADFNNLGNVAALDLAITDAEKEVVTTSAGKYQVLLQQGDDMVAGFTAGDIVAKDGTSVVKNSNDPDFNGVVSDGGSGFYVYTNWEDRTGGMSRIHVSGLGDNGYATTTKDGMLDFSSVEGTWVNCFGTVTPWSTPLSAEELYFDNTADWFNADYKYFRNAEAVASYLGLNLDRSGAWGNPYNYGYNVEVGTNGTVATANVADVEVEKRFALGRFSHENAVVMPDNRTVLQSDDGGNVVFFKFVADAANDLSAGTLYAAKMTQASSTTTTAEAAFAIEWIELGQGKDADIASWIAEYDGTFAEAKHITDQQVNDWAEAKLNEDLDGSGSVATSPFSDDRPAFLESRKVAKALGATAEFNKMEGVNINYDLASAWWNAGAADGDQAYAYMAMSTIGGGMTDDAGDVQITTDHGSCGAVYRMKLVKKNGLVDVQSMIPAIVGGPYYGDRSVNKCDVNNISNPDNLVILNDGRVLIGEDTGKHENNIIWVFDDPAI